MSCCKQASEEAVIELFTVWVFSAWNLPNTLFSEYAKLPVNPLSVCRAESIYPE